MIKMLRAVVPTEKDREKWEAFMEACESCSYKDIMNACFDNSIEGDTFESPLLNMTVPLVMLILQAYRSRPEHAAAVELNWVAEVVK